MTKEETYYTIRKLIKIYEKRIKANTNKLNNLNEEHTKETDENMDNLVSEIDLMQEFIEDLKNLMED